MKLLMVLFKILLIALLVNQLIACGGGGGSGDGNSINPNFTVSTNKLNVGVIFNSGQAPDQTISGTVSNYSGPLYIIITYTNKGISYISSPTISGNTGTSTVTMRFKPQGVYFDTITVLACSDPSCNNQLFGSPQIINVTYTVGIAVDPPTLNFSSSAGYAPPPQTITVYYNDNSINGSNWGSSYLYLNGSGWMSYIPASGQAPTQVEVTLDSLTTPGVYNAEIRFGANAGGTIFILPIQYTVN